MINIPIQPITPDLGVTVILTAEQLLDDDVAEQCLKLLNRHGVLVFPQIAISDETQVSFSNRLGIMRGSRLGGKDNEADRIGIYPVTLDPSRAKFLDYIHSNEHWHMDGATYAIPPKATSLKCEVPANEGGDTEFANVFAAYRDLPAVRRAALEGLRVIHSAAAANHRFFSNPSTEDERRWHRDGPPTEQPLVWNHADGRQSLVIGSTADHIVGMEPDVGRRLLDELLEWCTQPQYCYRHRWRRGDLVIWNNCGLLHRAHHYTRESGRLMHRTTIMGSEAIA
jgi:alpha-ketoglutarate-dependent taurine dioxygenase